jgi:hypothetical protein
VIGSREDVYSDRPSEDVCSDGPSEDVYNDRSQ